MLLDFGGGLFGERLPIFECGLRWWIVHRGGLVDRH
jgi:hypothetical protein